MDTLVDRADIDLAISSAKLISREVLVPGAGSSSYSVTTGPGRTFTTSPLTPKSAKTFSNKRAVCDNALAVLVGSVSGTGEDFKISIGGRV